MNGKEEKLADRVRRLEEAVAALTVRINPTVSYSQALEALRS